MKSIENLVQEIIIPKKPFNQVNIANYWYSRVRGELRKLCLPCLNGRTVPDCRYNPSASVGISVGESVYLLLNVRRA